MPEFKAGDEVRWKGWNKRPFWFVAAGETRAIIRDALGIEYGAFLSDLTPAPVDLDALKDAVVEAAEAFVSAAAPNRLCTCRAHAEHGALWKSVKAYRAALAGKEGGR